MLFPDTISKIYLAPPRPLLLEQPKPETETTLECTAAERLSWLSWWRQLVLEELRYTDCLSRLWI